MLKGLGINPFITRNSSLAEIEKELEMCLDRAENVLDWELTQKEEEWLMSLTRLAKAKGSTRKW
jgi:hypothetical protein